MKKIYILILSVLFAATVSAQSFNLIDAPASVSGAADDLISANFGVRNNTAFPIRVMVRRIVVDTVPGTLNYFCWVQCYPPDVDESPSPLEIPGNSSSYAFIGDYDPSGNAGTSTIRYKFYIEGNEDDSMSVTIDYVASPLNVITLQPNQFNMFPNPTNTGRVTVKGDVLNTAASLRVLDVTGKIVWEQNISKFNEGSVDLSTLHNGLYILQARDANKVLAQQKLIINKN